MIPRHLSRLILSTPILLANGQIKVAYRPAGNLLLIAMINWLVLLDS